MGLISAFIYAYVYFSAKFYADMSLQFYYVGISIYGWIYWSKKAEENPNEHFAIQYASTKIWTIILLIIAIFTLVIAYILINFTDSTIPYWDAFTTAASFVATWMLTKKYIGNWLIWIVVDSVSLVLYYQKELYSTVILFSVYTIMAFYGYFAWKKSNSP